MSLQRLVALVVAALALAQPLVVRAMGDGESMGGVVGIVESVMDLLPFARHDRQGRDTYSCDDTSYVDVYYGQAHYVTNFKYECVYDDNRYAFPTTEVSTIGQIHYEIAFGDVECDRLTTFRSWESHKVSYNPYDYFSFPTDGPFKPYHSEYQPTIRVTCLDSSGCTWKVYTCMYVGTVGLAPGTLLGIIIGVVIFGLVLFGTLVYGGVRLYRYHHRRRNNQYQHLNQVKPTSYYYTVPAAYGAADVKTHSTPRYGAAANTYDAAASTNGAAASTYGAAASTPDADGAGASSVPPAQNEPSPYAALP